MVSRSIVGRFLILAVLLVSLGVIAQAALIISKEPARTMAARSDPASTAPSSGSALAATARVPTIAAIPASAGAPAVAAQPLQPAEAAPVRVVYPGPLGDAPAPPHKIADAAPASPLSPPTPAPAVPTASGPDAVVSAAPVATSPVAPAQAPTEPAPAVAIASADAGTAPAPAAADATPAGKGVNLNSATVEALNHIGGGHIGQSIVQHRPYKSVEDLMKKRVVRRSVYEQIKNQVAAE